MRTYLAFALLAAGLLTAPLAFLPVRVFGAAAFAVGLAVLATQPAMRRGLVPALLVVLVLAPFAGGGVGSGESLSAGGSEARWRTVGEVRVPYELGDAGVAFLSGLAFLSFSVATALVLFLAREPVRAPKVFLAVLGLGVLGLLLHTVGAAGLQPYEGGTLWSFAWAFGMWLLWLVQLLMALALWWEAGQRARTSPAVPGEPVPAPLSARLSAPAPIAPPCSSSAPPAGPTTTGSARCTRRR